MTTKGFRGAEAIDKGIALFVRILEDAEQTPMAELAMQTAIPQSTAQRLVRRYVIHGLLARVAQGRYGPGVRLAALSVGLDPDTVLGGAARPLLRRLAKKLRMTVHLGVLENDMVTYLVKEHGGGAAVMTSERTQLEAYCSGIGKVLLAHLEPAAREAYLATAPFVALTANTITEPVALRAEFARIRANGHAIDNAELEDGVFCVAVPIGNLDGQVKAAISATSRIPCHNVDAVAAGLAVVAQAISSVVSL